MFCVLSFCFDLLFMSSIWTYGVGMGPDLLVDIFAEKAWMGSLGMLFASIFFDSI